MRLVDIITPTILERAIHWPLPDSKAEIDKMVEAMKADHKEKFISVGPLAEVFGKCLLNCGPIIKSTGIQDQLYLIHTILASLDAAIELATKGDTQ